jgi:hypothetical protein
MRVTASSGAPLAAVGLLPRTLRNASWNPLGDSYPLASAAAVTSVPPRMLPSAAASRRARLYA